MDGRSSGVIVTAALFSSLVLSSADLFSTINLRTVTGLGIAAREQRPLKTAGQMVGELRDGGFPVSAIAEMCCVERKSIYNWLDGGSVRQEHLDRLTEIYDALMSADVNLRSLYRVWNQRDAAGRTLKAILTDPVVDTAAILDRIDELQPAIAYYDQVGSRKASTSDRTVHIFSDLPVAERG
jgi:hypothetical protein